MKNYFYHLYNHRPKISISYPEGQDPKEVNLYKQLEEAHQQMREEYYFNVFKQELVEEITEEVLKRIHITANSKDAIQNIKGLKEEINKLFDGK